MGKIRLVIFLLGLSFASHTMAVNGFSTTETVRFVIECMANIGEQSDENLYTCACRFNALTEKIDYDTYSDARKFISYRLMPGEKGALFRDNQQGDKTIAMLEEANGYADSQCLQVKRVQGVVSDSAK